MCMILSINIMPMYSFPSLKKTRRSFNVVNFAKYCFFCGKGNSEADQLFSYRT